MWTIVRRERRALSAPVSRRGVERDLAQAAGAQAFTHRDPLYHVTESFRQTFERRGGERAALLESGSGFSEREAAGERTAREGAPTEAQRALPITQIPLREFSKLAFQRGELSASVLAGTGKLVLVSCLKQAVGQSVPQEPKVRTLFDLGSQRRNVPGRDPDQVFFGRGVAGSAVGLVIDALRDARRALLSLQEVAEGRGGSEADAGGAMLRMMCPFLDDSRERALLERYSRQLKDRTDSRERPILQSALVHTRSLLDKKVQMRVEFLNKLRSLSDRANEALAGFEAPGFVEELAEALLEGAPEPPEPPGDNRGGTDHGTDAEDRAADRAGPSDEGAAGPDGRGARRPSGPAGAAGGGLS